MSALWFAWAVIWLFGPTNLILGGVVFLCLTVLMLDIHAESNGTVLTRALAAYPYERRAKCQTTR